MEFTIYTLQKALHFAVNANECSFILLTLSLPECLIEFCKVTLTFESVDEIL